MKNSGRIMPKMKPVLAPLSKRYTKEQIQDAIEKNNGIVTVICNQLDATYTQFWKCIKQLQLVDCLNEARECLAHKAESTLATLLDSDSEAIQLKAAEDILKYRGQNIGWTTQPQTVIQQAVISDADKKIRICNIFGVSPENLSS